MKQAGQAGGVEQPMPPRVATPGSPGPRSETNPRVPRVGTRSQLPVKGLPGSPPLGHPSLLPCSSQLHPS
eukprot:7376166-Prorocentrum_lima.AAC.1